GYDRASVTGLASLAALTPALPTVDTDRQEEDLSARLAPQVVYLRLREHSPDEDREQDQVADDPDGPCHHRSLAAEQSARDPEPVAHDLADEQGAAPDRDGALEQPVEHRLGLLAGEESFDVLRENVDLEVHDVADALDAERRRAQRLGYQRNGERGNVVEHSDHRERGAVDGDRPLLDDVSRQLRVECDLHELPVVTGDPVGDPPDAVDVALHDVAAVAGTSGHGTFEVHPVAGPEAGQSRTVECLAHDI